MALPPMHAQQPSALPQITSIMCHLSVSVCDQCLYTVCKSIFWLSDLDVCVQALQLATS